jgi:hypothetical protein
MAVSKLNPSAGGVPYGDNAKRPANPEIGRLYSNGEEKRLELYTAQGWQNIVSETPGVVSISGNYIESTGSGTLEITGTNFTTGALASVIGTNGVEVQATSTIVNSIVSVTAAFSGLSIAYEPYDIKITNTSNLFGILPDALYINDSPIWQTASGLLGTFNINSSVSIQLAVNDDESNTITYSVVSGSLPSGISLSSSGLLSGTISAANGTYSFTVSASDGSNTAITRSFSIACVAPVITGGSLSSDSTYFYRTFTSNGDLSVSTVSLSADILVVAGGAGGGGQRGGGGGAGGVVYLPSTNLTTGTKAIVVGGGGSLGAVGANRGGNGVNSQFALLTAAVGGGGGGGDNNPLSSGVSGGSGGGACNYDGAVPGTGTSGQGNSGGGRSGQAPNYGSGGGGGAGGAGVAGDANAPGVGGSGTNTHSSILSAISSSMSSVSGWQTATSSGYIAGGGAGGYYQSTSGTRFSGGAGGGGRSGASGVPGENGVTNTGGGAGGGWNGGNDVAGGAGGSGIVVVRYTKSQVGA